MPRHCTIPAQDGNTSSHSINQRKRRKEKNYQVNYRRRGVYLLVPRRSYSRTTTFFCAFPLGAAGTGQMGEAADLCPCPPGSPARGTDRRKRALGAIGIKAVCPTSNARSGRVTICIKGGTYDARLGWKMAWAFGDGGNGWETSPPCSVCLSGRACQPNQQRGQERLQCK